MLGTDIIIGNFSRNEYCFKKDKIGFFFIGEYFCLLFYFSNVKSESLQMWLVMIVLGETLRHLFLFYKLKPSNKAPDTANIGRTPQG